MTKLTFAPVLVLAFALAGCGGPLTPVQGGVRAPWGAPAPRAEAAVTPEQPAPARETAAALAPAAPEPSAPEPSAPEPSAPEPSAPETTAPETTAPETAPSAPAEPATKAPPPEAGMAPAPEAVAAPVPAPTPGPAPRPAPAIAPTPSSIPRPGFAPDLGADPGFGRSPIPPADGPSAPAAERYVSLNFDNADLPVVIQTIAELLHLNYIVAPTVRGRVTIQTSEKLPVSSLLAVLDQILQVNNLVAVKSGSFYKIVPANQAKQESLESVAPEEPLPAATGVVTKIVRLHFIGPGEVVKILTPFKSAAGLYQAHEAARLLFLTESPGKLAELMKIVEVLDVDTFASIQVELYPVRFAEVEALARELTQIVTQIYSASGKGRSLYRIVAVPQGGAIMVFSGEPGLAANIREWIAKLDQPASEAGERIFVFPLSHANAETLAGVIEKVFRRETTRTTTPRTSTPAAQQPAGRTSAQAGAPAAAAPAAVSGGTALAAPGAATVIVVPDKDTNTLIVQTASWFYPSVEEVIRKLDVMPKQVLIEVLIAEVTLDDNTQFGIQWALKGQGTTSAFGETHGLTTSTALSAAASASALSFSVVEANRLSAAISAYAKDSKLNVLSAPHIIASNNKEAKIDVGNEVPILKTMTTATTGSSTTDTVTNDIEYRSTGIILTVTPHVNEGGFVTLDLQQEVSEAQSNTLGGTDSPIIRKRTAKTTMVVKDDQTLVVGGLIQESRDTSREGLPWLHRIPLLGYLFGSKSATIKKTELVLLITPRVIESIEEGDRMTRQVQDRVLTLKEGLKQIAPLGAEGAR